MRDVYVIGAYTTVFKKHPGMSFADLAREPHVGTLADAGMNKGADIESGWLGNCGMGFWGQNSIRPRRCSSRWSRRGSVRSKARRSRSPRTAVASSAWKRPWRRW